MMMKKLKRYYILKEMSEYLNSAQTVKSSQKLGTGRVYSMAKCYTIQMFLEKSKILIVCNTVITVILKNKNLYIKVSLFLKTVF
jgi:hypothetical protein